MVSEHASLHYERDLAADGDHVSAASASVSTRKTTATRARRALWGILVLTALLHTPALRWSVACDDEGTYEAMAYIINDGGVMYRDALDHKPPGLAYVYAAMQRLSATTPAGGNLVAVHLFGMLAAALTAWGLFLVAKQFLPTALTPWPPLLYTLTSTAKFAWDGIAVNGEMMMNLPTVFAVWAVLRGTKAQRQLPYDILAGALIGVAALFKWQASIAGLAFPFFSGPHPCIILGQLKRAPGWLVGLALPLACAAAFFAHHGVLGDAVRWGLRFNLQYIGEGPSLGLALSHLCNQVFSLILPAGLVYWFGLRGLRLRGVMTLSRARVQPGLVVWTLAALACVAMGGRFFGHYFLQPELPLALVAAEPVAALWRRRPRWVAAGLVVPALAFVVFGFSPSLSRALNMDTQPDWAELGARLDAALRPDDTLFIWGNTPMLYHYGHRAMGTRFAFSNYLTGMSPATSSESADGPLPEPSAQTAWPELLADLDARRPSVILDTASAGWKGYGKFQLEAYPALRDYVAAHYSLDGALDGAVIYRRVD